MKLTKTTKKLDNNICKALTIACESALHDADGFSWLTHRVSYTDFPASLIITCVFETQADIKAMEDNGLSEDFRKSIQKELLKVAVVVKNINKTIRFDSEDACNAQHAGHWDNRLALNIAKQKPTNINKYKR